MRHFVRKILGVAVSAAVSLGGLAFAPPAHADTWVNVPVRIWTGTKDGAGTDANIQITIGCYSYEYAPDGTPLLDYYTSWQELDKSSYNDFENGDVDDYNVSINQNKCRVPAEVRLSVDGSITWGDTWLLHNLRVDYQGSYYWIDRLDTWLKPAYETTDNGQSHRPKAYIFTLG